MQVPQNVRVSLEIKIVVAVRAKIFHCSNTRWRKQLAYYIALRLHIHFSEIPVSDMEEIPVVQKIKMWFETEEIEEGAYNMNFRNILDRIEQI